MVDKKMMMVILVLVVAAFLVLAGMLVAPLVGKASSGKSFSALFDKMVMNEDERLVLASGYEAGDLITIRDKIISMETSFGATIFYFVYTGKKWVNNTGGTDFDVKLSYGVMIRVNNAMFSITIPDDHSSRYMPGDFITLQTTVVSYGGDLVPSRHWAAVY